MRKQLITSMAAMSLLTAAPASGSGPSVTWEIIGNTLSEDYRPVYRERFTVEGTEGPFTRLAFCVNKHDMHPVNPLDTVIEILPGYYAVGSPRFSSAAPGDTVVVDIITGGWFHNAFEMPDGMHLVDGNRTIPAVNIRKSITARPEQWKQAGLGHDPMVYGDAAYEINDSLRSSWRPGAYMQIPTPKSVTLTGGKVGMPALMAVSVDDPRQDYWRVEISGDTATVHTNSASPAAVLANVERRMRLSADEDGKVPAATIEDWADYSYRGLMLDVARNFTTKEEVKRIISLMSRYGLNVLHFHLGDDEGWRVEIHGLPELTSVGGRRGYTVDDNVDFLKQIYSGDGSPLSDTPANGFYTEDDYIDILRHAHSMGVEVIPEFDSPGHSRAAIRAMERRYRTTGDDSLRLIHDGDRSEYSTAQFFHDNLMNPALDGPYRFWGKVMDGIIEIYGKAGVPLPAINIGGDEVPEHAWDGSDIAVKFMADKGMTHQRDLHAYFVERLSELARDRGVKIAGWQEIALDHSPEYNAKVAPVTRAVNSWTNAGDQGSRMAAAGFPVVLSNVDYLYIDQTPTTHPEEPGLTWGGLVDEFRPLHATAEALCPGDSATLANVVGISCQLFAETVRDPGMMQRYIFPRILGVAERAHNARPTLSDNEYFGALTSEMPGWAGDGVQFYVRQPGIRISGGNVEMNDAYGLGEIRYTLDGSDPTRSSSLYTGPIAWDGTSEIRARLFMGPSWSVVSILPVSR